MSRIAKDWAMKNDGIDKEALEIATFDLNGSLIMSFGQRIQYLLILVGVLVLVSILKMDIV